MEKPCINKVILSYPIGEQLWQQIQEYFQNHKNDLGINDTSASQLYIKYSVFIVHLIKDYFLS